MVGETTGPPGTVWGCVWVGSCVKVSHYNWGPPYMCPWQCLLCVALQPLVLRVHNSVGSTSADAPERGAGQ